jgi:hypothetical protein
MVLLKNGENQATLEQNRPPAVISMVLRVHNYVSQNNKRTGSDIYITMVINQPLIIPRVLITSSFLKATCSFMKTSLVL